MISRWRSEVFRRVGIKGEVSDGDQRATKGVLMREILNDMYLILIKVINNLIIFNLILKGQPT